MSRLTPARSLAVALIALAAVSALVAHASAPAKPAAATATAKSATATAPAKGDAAAAKAIYTAKCVVCHKADGSGGVKLTGNPTPNWKDPKHWANPKINDDFLRDCLVNGKPKSGMVAWGKTGQLKPADIENLIALIHTLKPAKK